MMNRKNTENKVFSFMEKHRMVQSGDHLILGVSGGADSVCLLFLLQEYQKRMPFELTVVHVNHGIRGAAAGEDAAFVEGICRERGVLCRTVSVDVPAYAKAVRCSEEDAGRRLRYQAFEETARMSGGNKIAVAHNAQDRAETMLLHLFRGSGLKGLCGIEPVRGNIIRPLLCLERGEIEEYVRQSGVEWRRDHTNDEDAYTRNRVRHHILPLAEKEVSDRSVIHMCRTADILSETEDYLRGQTLAAMQDCVVWERARAEIAVERFNVLHPALQKRLLLELCERASPTGKDISAVHVTEALELFERPGNRRLELPYDICVRREYGTVMIGRREELPQGELPEYEFSEIFVINREEVPQNKYTKWFDYDKMEEPPTFRFRQTGDYLTLSDGRGGVLHKPLKEYMVTEKIPRDMRDRIPVLAVGKHVVWLVGYRISEYYKVDGNTERVLQVKIFSEEENLR